MTAATDGNPDDAASQQTISAEIGAIESRVSALRGRGDAAAAELSALPQQPVASSD